MGGRLIYSIPLITGILLFSSCDAGPTEVDDRDGLSAGLVLSTEEVGLREDGTGAFRTNCLPSHEGFDDPLVYPGQHGASHHHVFFGNPTVDANTTSETLLRAEETTCDGNTLNRSAYWVPSLFDASGEPVAYVEPLFYYKTGYHVPASTIEPFPEGLRMIAGQAMANTAQHSDIIKFRCSSWTSNQAWFDPGDPLDHISTLPDCPPGDVLEVRIVFPQCWDGQHLFLSDQSHMAYPSRATPPVAGTGSCPDTHPIALPEISYNFAIYVTADTGRGTPSAWRFVSDLVGGTTGGVTLHADWMNGWDPDIMNTIVENCLRPARECMVGLLGDGTRLDPVVVD